MYATSERRRPLTLLLGMGLAMTIGGCSADRFVPPAPSAVIRAEEARLAPLIEGSQRSAFMSGPGHCSVRVLGISGSTSFAWADCSFSSGQGIDSAVSTAFRIDGTTVRAPRDGNEYADSIRRMFPHDMAEAILKRPDELRPS